MSLPYRLLEINIISAQDLPPVSKMLRTFVVAWVNPDNKLSTQVDHHGHTNPTWNYKLMFRVDDNFLQSAASAITIEVYNVAWLRDLPIGTTRLLINHISPPLTHKNPSPRFVSLHIRRPSGHLQGMLNISVNLAGDSNIPAVRGDGFRNFYLQKRTPPGVETLSLPTTPKRAILLNNQVQKRTPPGVEILSLPTIPKNAILLNNQVQEQNNQTFYNKDSLGGEKSSLPTISKPEILLKKQIQEQKGQEFDYKDSNNQMQRSKSTRIRTPAEDISPLPESITWSLSESDAKSKAISSNNSVSVAMKPLPSEVASDLKKGIYSTSGNDIGSSIFDNWTLSHSSENTLKPISIPKPLDDQINLMPEDRDRTSRSRPRRRRSKSDGGGLMSCFGKAYGFEFTFFCGSKSVKESRKKKA